MKAFFLFLCVFASSLLFSQDVSVLLKQADNLDKQIRETEAIEKYKEVLLVAPDNFKALTRLTELYAAIGARQPKSKDRLPYFTQASEYANKAFTVDSSNADALYLLSLVHWKMSTADLKNKEEVSHLRSWKEYADKALLLEPGHARAMFLLGKWHIDMTQASVLKKAASKTIYGGMSKWDIETGIKLLEQVKSIDQYFVQNYYELAKAYEYNNQPTQQLETLNRLVKMPVRTGDDPAWKAEGKKMLEQMK